jgi:hypothetical protein
LSSELVNHKNNTSHHKSEISLISNCVLFNNSLTSSSVKSATASAHNKNCANALSFIPPFICSVAEISNDLSSLYNATAN